MVQKSLNKILVATALFSLVATARAAPVVLTGNYLDFGVSDYGTFGSNGSTEPGIIHDPTGSGNFSACFTSSLSGCNDYLTPGAPHQGFSINSDQTGFINNDNEGSASFASVSGPTLTTVAGYSLAATWTGTDSLGDSITNTYYLNAGDETINVATTITAGAAGLTNLAFATSLDPDPDVYTDGDFSTNNQEGNSLYGPTDFVGAAGAATGLTIGILNTSGNTYVHNTEIDGDCCSNIDPNLVLLGGLGDGGGASCDCGINLAYEIGALAGGNTLTIDYAYVVGANISTVGAPTPPTPPTPPTGPTPVPEPGSLALLGAAILGVAVCGAKRSAPRLPKAFS